MRVTAKADYAVRAVAELAAAGDGFVKADEVARRQEIPRHFLDNILTDLRRAGIVATQRGAEGGSKLARSAQDITIADIMRATEGPLAAVRDIRPEQLVYDGAAASLPTPYPRPRLGLRISSGRALIEAHETAPRTTLHHVRYRPL